MAVVVKIGNICNSSETQSYLYGIKVNNYIVAHCGILTEEQLTSDLHVLEEIDLSSQISRPYSKVAKVLSVWTCRSFQRFFDAYFDPNNFGLKQVRSCASFVLLTVEIDDETRHTLNVSQIIKDIRQALPLDADIFQGKRVCFVQDEGNKNKSLISRKLGHGLVSYLFHQTEMFTVDLDVSPSDLILSFADGSRDITYLGLVVFKDLLEYPFQVFPVCVSLRHLLGGECQAGTCCPTHPRHVSLERQKGITPHSLVVECGGLLGSGSLIWDDVVLTCSHTVIHQLKSKVNVHAKSEVFEARVLYKRYDGEWPDLALLVINRIPGQYWNQPILRLASRFPSLGGDVLAVGTPYVRSRLKREPWLSSGKLLGYDSKVLLASCPIHEGFSGGSLLDSKSKRLIGLIEAKAYPLRGTSPPRLLQAVPLINIGEHILRFIASPRTPADVAVLTKQLEAVAERKAKSKL